MWFVDFFEKDKGNLLNLLQEMKQLADQGQYSRAITSFSREIPLRPLMLYDDAYYQQQVFYYLGLLLTKLNDEEAAFYIQKSGLLSAGDQSNILFDHHLQLSKEILQRQMEAIKRGIPYIFITSLPKSASAFVSNTIAKILDIPVLRASVGNFPNAIVIPNWVMQLKMDGCVTHEHFNYREKNVLSILGKGISKLFIQIRDPRACLWSLFHHTQKIYPDKSIDFNEYQKEVYVPLVDWIAGWIAVKKQVETSRKLVAPEHPFAVHFIFYRDVRTNPSQVIQEIFEINGMDEYSGNVDVYFKNSRLNNPTPDNFRVGNDDDWRNYVSLDMQKELWRQIPEEVRELLQLSE